MGDGRRCEADAIMHRNVRMGQATPWRAGPAHLVQRSPGPESRRTERCQPARAARKGRRRVGVGAFNGAPRPPETAATWKARRRWGRLKASHRVRRRNRNRRLHAGRRSVRARLGLFGQERARTPRRRARTVRDVESATPGGNESGDPPVVGPLSGLSHPTTLGRQMFRTCAGSLEIRMGRGAELPRRLSAGRGRSADQWSRGGA